MANAKKKIKNIIKFLNDAERLKFALRHSWLSNGRRESVAEHCWRMSLLAFVLKDDFPKVNINQVIKISLVHDLGEVYEGDTPAFLKKSNHHKKEEKDIKKVLRPLSSKLRNEIYNLWQEYNLCQTPEAKLAKAIDKLEVLIQHNEANISTWLKKEYKLNLTHGLKYNQYNNFIKKFRQIVDEMTRKKISNSKK